MQKSFQDLLRKQEGDRSVWEYPFAVAGVNITFMLIQMLDLEAGMYGKTSSMLEFFSGILESVSEGQISAKFLLVEQ